MSDESTRTRLLHIAGAVFAEQGYEKATIREICRRADVNLASVNYHFGDKERLYRESIKHAHRYRMSLAPLPNWSPGVPPETRLRDFVRTTITWMLMEVEELPWQHKLMMRETLQPTGACQEIVEDLVRPHFDLLLSILDELVPESMTKHRRHQLGFSIIGQCIFYRFSDHVVRTLIDECERAEHFTPLQIADHVTEVTLAALGRGTLGSKNQHRERLS